MQSQQSTREHRVAHLFTWALPDADREQRLRAELALWFAGMTDDEFAVAAQRWHDRSLTGPARGAVVASDPAEAARAVRAAAPSRPAGRATRPVALLFPGQGAQHSRMAAGLYGWEPVFTSTLDEVFDLWLPEGDDLREDWLSPSPRVPTEDVTRAQPLLFAVELSLGRMLFNWGVRPVAMLGHSVGEVVAATLAGTFTVPDAVGVMRDRIRRLEDTPPGGMLAVAATVDQLTPYLAGDVVVGAVNAPRQTVLAGPDPELGSVARALAADGFACQRARARTAFHSPVVAPACTPPAAGEGPELRPPCIPLYSCYTGNDLADNEATSQDYWAHQPAAPVVFWPAVDRLLRTGPLLLIEVGPAQGLTSIVRRHRAVASGASAVAGLLPTEATAAPDSDRRAVLSVAADLWREGHYLFRENLPPES